MHFAIALLAGALYFQIGQDAAYVLDNFNLLFFSVMFLMYNAFSATMITCKFAFSGNLISTEATQALYLIL